MDREEAKLFAPLIQAFADGKTIECRSFTDKWAKIDHFSFSYPPINYRIRPEPREVFAIFYENRLVTAVFTEDHAKHFLRQDKKYTYAKFREVRK